MHARDYFDIKNQKKDSPIENIYTVGNEVHVICKGSGHDSAVENFLESKFPGKTGAIYFWDDEIGIWCSAKIKDVVFALPSLACDTEEKLKAKYEGHEMNIKLYNNFYSK